MLEIQNFYICNSQKIMIRAEANPSNQLQFYKFNHFIAKIIKDISMSKKQIAKAPEPAKTSGFDPKKYAVNGVTEEEVKTIKQAFDLFDSDQGGSVDIKELKAAMTSLGFQSKSQSIFQMISDLDADGNGSIDFGEWFNLMTKRVNNRDSRDNINKIFMLFDDRKDGYLTIGNLRRIAESLGEHVSEQELLEMIVRADTNLDLRVSADEFYQILTRNVKE